MLITTIFRFASFFLIALFTTIGVQAQMDGRIPLADEYYNKGELEKAQELYEDISKRTSNIPLIHKNYFDLLLNTAQFKAAESYIKKAIKKIPGNVTYQIDLGRIYINQGKEKEADTHFKRIINDLLSRKNMVRITAQYFANHQLLPYAEATYKKVRKAENDPTAYAIELANIYRVANKKDLMVEEYIGYLQRNKGSISQIKNILQNQLTDEEDLTKLETLLYSKIQSNPNEPMYPELLIWVNVQQKNFYGSFIQARAFDKRFGTDGQKLLEVGKIALKNKDYGSATEIFEYTTKAYPSGKTYILARRYLINAREFFIKNQYPIKEKEVRKLVADYQKLADEVGLNPTTLEGLRNKALLQAFYLDEKQLAITTLKKTINSSSSDKQLIARCKLDLGDIYLLSEEPWESTLLYSQVEKAQKDNPLGHDAKLRNAKLSYYKGDFELAQAHLDILKLATSREIANDAISLSLLIKDNTIMDTTYTAMQAFAAIDLLVFQNKKAQAISALDSMLQHFSGHSLTDEILYQQAKLYLDIGEFEKPIALLTRIVIEYPIDILADDALFLKGKIFEENRNEPEKAQEVYQKLMTDYPGSLFVAEARKRFRKLRGDLLN